MFFFTVIRQKPKVIDIAVQTYKLNWQWANLVDVQIRVILGREKSLSCDHGPEDEKLPGLPLGGLMISSAFRAIGECKWIVVEVS